MEKILNEIEEIRKEIFQLGFTGTKENENYNKTLRLMDRLQEAHNDIYDHSIKQDRLIKNLVDWLREERGL
tara:strand:- start:53 stop:265 length:213 start_codon:yes stop_codon:yes gene_type:complete